MNPIHAMSADVDWHLPDRIASSLASLDSWIENEKFRGWDPHDALNSPVLRQLTLGNRFAGIFWLQLLKNSPINFRRLLLIPKGYNPKGMGLFLSSYARKYAAYGDPRHREYINFFARWLIENASTGYHGRCWGYNFDWPNRSFFAPAGTPTVVNTAFIGLAFLDMHCLLGGKFQNASTTGENVLGLSPLDVARSSCDFVLHDLNQLATADDELCFSYTPLDRRPVHNASLLGAWLLAAVFKQTCEPHLGEAALAAARFTARRQMPDGSWRYGEASNDPWVDNFHTGFVLVALRRVADALRTDEFEQNILRGYRFWKERMFLADGTPKYYPGSTYPIDVHSVAQAVLTFLEFREDDKEAVEHALHVARWGIENLQDPSGYFYYRKCRYYSIRIPYIRWSQAWMQRALTELDTLTYAEYLA